MSVNGHDPLESATKQAKANLDEVAARVPSADQMLSNVLHQALNQPARVTRVTGPCVVTVAIDENRNPTLLVGMVNGDRWDIPLDVNTSRRVAFALASAGTPDNIEDDRDLAA